MILIGVDVGANDNSAIAVYHEKKKVFYEISSGSLFQMLDQIIGWNQQAKGKIVVVIEDNTLEKKVFNQWEKYWDLLCGFFYRKIGTKIHLKREFHKILNRAQSVGKNKMLCKMFIQELESRGISHVRISPSSRDRADKQKKRFGVTLTAGNLKYYKMPTKTTAQQFKDLSGYTPRTNEHQRDAGTLVLGKQLINLVYLAKKHYKIDKFIASSSKS